MCKSIQCGVVLIVAVMAQPGAGASERRSPNDSPLFCNLNALTAAERTRHQELTRRLFDAVGEHRRLADGFTFRVDGQRFPIVDLAEWIVLERRCCPFFRFQFDLQPGKDSLWISLRGPKGAREIIEAGLPALN